MKKFLSIFLALCMVLSLWGCGNSRGSGEDRAAKWQKLYDAGAKYLSEGGNDEAVAAFTAAIKTDPNRVKAYIGRGDAYMNLASAGAAGTEKLYEKAQADYGQAIRIDDKTAETYTKLAGAYTAAGDGDKAREVLERGYKATGDETIKPSAAPTPTPTPAPAPKSDHELTLEMCNALADSKYAQIIGKTYDWVVAHYGKCTGFDCPGGTADRGITFEKLGNAALTFNDAEPTPDDYSGDAYSYTGEEIDAMIYHDAVCTDVSLLLLSDIYEVPAGGFVPDRSICGDVQTFGSDGYCFDYSGQRFWVHNLSMSNGYKVFPDSEAVYDSMVELSIWPEQ
jgi:tetratricopeptide (TPR) repeat protein